MFCWGRLGRKMRLGWILAALLPENRIQRVSKLVFEQSIFFPAGHAVGSQFVEVFKLMFGLRVHFMSLVLLSLSQHCNDVCFFKDCHPSLKRFILGFYHILTWLRHYELFSFFYSLRENNLAWLKVGLHLCFQVFLMKVRNLNGLCIDQRVV